MVKHSSVLEKALQPGLQLSKEGNIGGELYRADVHGACLAAFIMGRNILGPKNPPPRILGHNLFCQHTHAERDLRIFCFPFHSSCKYAQLPSAIPLQEMGSIQ